MVVAEMSIVSTPISSRPAVTAFLLPDRTADAARHAADKVRPLKAVGEFLKDGVLVAVAMLLLPIAILIIGMPIALVGWALIEVAQKLF